MSFLNSEIKKRIVAPTFNQLKDGEKLIAEVIKTYPNENTCDIDYLDNDGSKVRRTGVYVRVYAKGIISWFPSKGDMVIVEKIGNSVEIVSGVSAGYYQSKGELEIKNDLMENFSEGICGNIF